MNSSKVITYESGEYRMDFEKLRVFRQNRNLFCKKLGMMVEEIQLGYARVIKTIKADDVNPIGRPHGGVYFTMADHAAGTAMASHGYQAVTLDCSFHFFRAANMGDTLTAVAQEVKYGQTISVFDVEIKSQIGALLAKGTFTFFRLDEAIDI